MLQQYPIGRNEARSVAMMMMMMDGRTHDVDAALSVSVGGGEGVATTGANVATTHASIAWPWENNNNDHQFFYSCPSLVGDRPFYLLCLRCHAVLDGAVMFLLGCDCCLCPDCDEDARRLQPHHDKQPFCPCCRAPRSLPPEPTVRLDLGSPPPPPPSTDGGSCSTTTQAVQRLLCVDIDDEPADNPYGSATTTLPSKQITHETMHRNLLQMLHAERRVVRVVIKQLLVQAGPEFAQRLLASLPVMGASTTPPPSLPTDLIVVDGGGGVRAAVEELREQLELAHQAELEKVENFQRVKQDLERQIQEIEQETSQLALANQELVRKLASSSSSRLTRGRDQKLVHNPFLAHQQSSHPQAQQPHSATATMNSSAPQMAHGTIGGRTLLEGSIHAPPPGNWMLHPGGGGSFDENNNNLPIPSVIAIRPMSSNDSISTVGVDLGPTGRGGVAGSAHRGVPHVLAQQHHPHQLHPASASTTPTKTKCAPGFSHGLGHDRRCSSAVTTSGNTTTAYQPQVFGGANSAGTIRSGLGAGGGQQRSGPPPARFR